MRIDQNKSSVEKQEIRQDGKPCEPVRFTKGMAKSLTMLDIIGLVVLTTLQSGLFHNTPTGSDNQNEKDESSA